jgi:hypothetical protein
VHDPPWRDLAACVAVMDGAQWYTATTGSTDPMQWSGGDFLPVNYQSAAACACSG